MNPMGYPGDASAMLGKIIRVLLLFSLSLCFCGYLICGSAAASDEDTLADLDSPSYETRQRATEALLRDDTLTLDDVAELYARAESIEQRHRLLAVGRHHFLVALQAELFPPPGSGAIGMSHETVRVGDIAGLDTPAVHVLRTLPGFPAYARLRVDDLIVAYEGRPLPDDLAATGFTPLIEGKSRGDTIELTILRDDQRQTLRFELASASALSALFDSGTLDLRPPFREQWQAIHDAIVAGGPIPPLGE